MQLKNQELAVIKQALQVALKQDESEQASYSYREVLAKLMNVDFRSHTEEEERFHFNAGLRFDYDDGADA